MVANEKLLDWKQRHDVLLYVWGVCRVVLFWYVSNRTVIPFPTSCSRSVPFVLRGVRYRGLTAVVTETLLPEVKDQTWS